jgi:hypothetical protein
MPCGAPGCYYGALPGRTADGAAGVGLGGRCRDCDGTGLVPLETGVRVAAILGDPIARSTASAIDRAQLAQIDVSWPRFADVLKATCGGNAHRHVATRVALAAARTTLPRFRRNGAMARLLRQRVDAMELALLGRRSPCLPQLRTRPLGTDVEFVWWNPDNLTAQLTDAERMVSEVDFTGGAAHALLREAIRDEVVPWALGLRDPLADKHKETKA